jgi:hypothetical protein
MSFQNQAGIDAEINAQLPSNHAGTITAAALRQVLHDMNAVAFQVASSQGLTYSVFQYGAVGNGSTNDAVAFNAALAANAYVVAPPASYLVGTPQIVVPAGVTLETFPGASLNYAGPGLTLSPGGAFITKTYGDQKDGWLWARSPGAGARSSTLDPLSLLGVGPFNYGFWSLSDNGQTASFVNNLVSFQQFGGSAVTGGRNAFVGWAQLTAPTNSGARAFRDYSGVTGIGEAQSGDGGTNTGAGAQAAIFGGNFQSRLGAGATNLLAATGVEIDCYGASASSTKYNWALSLCAGYATTVGSLDAALAVYSLGASSPYPAGGGFGNGIVFAEISASGLPPLSSGATVLGTHIESPGTFPNGFSVAAGIDLRGFNIPSTSYAFATKTGVVLVGTPPVAQTAFPHFQISVANPELALTDTGGGANAKTWDFTATSGFLLGRAINDAYNAASNWLIVGRSGGAAGAVSFPAGNVQIGTTGVTGTLGFTGATSGSTSLLPNAVASGALTLPAATDTLVGRATTDTLTNKTLSAPVIAASLTTGAKAQARYFPLNINGTTVNVLTD